MGFFTLPTKPALAGTKTAATKKKEVPIRVLATQPPYNRGCLSCTLNKEEKNLHHPKMDATGAKRPLVYILGEAPGKPEDDLGEQFVGKSGELIRDNLPDELLGRVRWSNTVQCRPPGNRTPTPTEIACCSNRLVPEIEKTKPKLIIGFGAVPLNWAIGESFISDWRGDIIPVRVGSHECWYAVMWHPSFILRMKNDKKNGDAFHDRFLKDLRKACSFVLSHPDPPYIPTDEETEEGLIVLDDFKLTRVERELDLLASKHGAKHQSVDIETNGLRPYTKDSRILTISFGTWKRAVAFPVAHRESKWSPKQIKLLWGLVGEYMREAGCTFWANHLKFEMEWLSMPWALGTDILYEVDWDDTMAQAHVLSSKSLKGLSLDSRCKALFGVAEKSLDAMDRSRLDFAPLAKVLKYNARDTKFTDLVRYYQTPLIKAEGLKEAHRIIVERVPALTIDKQRGVEPDTGFAGRKLKELTGQITAIDKAIQARPEVKKLVAKTGKPFNAASNPQLTTLFRDQLKVKEGALEDGKYTTNENVLEAVRHKYPIAALILDKRGLDKLVGTYIEGLCEKDAKNTRLGKLIWEDGLIHTVFNYLRTTTGRLSSEDPNMQNFPKRQHKDIRAAIRAPKVHVVVSIDYGQIEFRVIGMASHCPVIAAALWEHYDVHMAWTKIIKKAHPHKFDAYLRETEGDDTKALKLFRSDIKNQWTFPLFFGSSLFSVARALELDPDRRKPQFTSFWKQFAAVKKWQKRLDDSYYRRGYVETLTGRRRYGPLGYNERINSPIQGTASDIVVDGMVELAYKSYETDRPQLAARLNIHDDLTFYLPKVTIEEDLPMIVETMVTPRFDFIQVPLTVEVATGPNWADLTELVTVESTEYGLPKRLNA